MITKEIFQAIKNSIFLTCSMTTIFRPWILKIIMNVVHKMVANVYHIYAYLEYRWAVKKQDNPVLAEVSSYFLSLGPASVQIPAHNLLGLNWN